MLDVTVVLLDDGYASTSVLPIEIFHSAGALWRAINGEDPAPRFCVTTASITGGAVNSPYAGLKMTPERGINDIARTDIIVVPTSGLAMNEKLIENSALLPWLSHHHARGAYLAGVCMGAGYLAEAGLLDGKQATTHWAIAPDFVKRWPKVNWRGDMFVTEESRLLCSGGLTAAADVSLYLVEKLCGHEVAVQTAKALLLNMPRTSQSGYAMLPLSPPHNDDAVRAAEQVLQSGFRDDICVDALADTVGMSPRTFLRRFSEAAGMPPNTWLQQERMARARRLLETKSAMSADDIALQCGYESIETFRAAFRRIVGVAPATYRARFAPSPATDR